MKWSGSTSNLVLVILWGIKLRVWSDLVVLVILWSIIINGMKWMVLLQLVYESAKWKKIELKLFE